MNEPRAVAAGPKRDREHGFVGNCVQMMDQHAPVPNRRHKDGTPGARTFTQRVTTLWIDRQSSKP